MNLPIMKNESSERVKPTDSMKEANENKGINDKPPIDLNTKKYNIIKTNNMKNLVKAKRKNENFILGWLDPRDNTVNYAGIAFYLPKYGEYVLKIDEEPREKQYFLKPFEGDTQGGIDYRMEMVIKRKDGSFFKTPNGWFWIQ